MKHILLFALLCLGVSCKKDKNITGHKKSANELLTQNEWILSAAGFDDNKNGVLDLTENSIADCQQDNSYVFNTNGTGVALDNAISCGVPMNNNFNWRFLHNDTELEIGFERIYILRLNEKELLLNPHLPFLTVNFMMIYSANQ